MSSSDEKIVLELTDGITFFVGEDTWAIEPLKVSIGKLIALVPEGPMPVPNPAGPLSWILATMEEPSMGTVELFGHDIYRLAYGVRQRLRSRVGYVHGYGGLLSNRTVAENIALPVTIHGGLNKREEEEIVTNFLEKFSLLKVANLQPHEMDGATRWRVCLARALVLKPTWVVLEGLGNWEMDQGLGVGWTELTKRQETLPMSTVICLTCHNKSFEDWFENAGGTILRYTKYRESN